jgi:hypothetical protein
VAAPDARQELEILLCELFTTYSSTDAPGTAGLLNRLTASYRHRIVIGDPGERTRRAPGPRPPGPDAALLARDEIEEIIVWWVCELIPDRQSFSPARAAELLPILASQHANGAWLDEVLTDIRGQHRSALLVLGLAEPPAQLRVPCLGCGRLSICFDRRATGGDLWCGRGGYAPEACHDDDRWPDCRDATGQINCRRSPRSVRHCRRWPRARIGDLVPAEPGSRGPST